MTAGQPDALAPTDELRATKGNGAVTKKYSYDLDCANLAGQFMADTRLDSRLLPELAQTIQDAIEAWLDEQEREAAAKEPAL